MAVDFETSRHYGALIRALRFHHTGDFGGASTSEVIECALALDREDLLPRMYDTFGAAWNRLDPPQREFVVWYRQRIHSADLDLDPQQQLDEDDYEPGP